jgi:hypothetical protein
MGYTCDLIYIAAQNSRENQRIPMGKSGNAVWIFTRVACNYVKDVNLWTRPGREADCNNLVKG